MSGYFEAESEVEALGKAEQVIDGLMDLAEEGLGGDVIGAVVEIKLDLKNASINLA